MSNLATSGTTIGQNIQLGLIGECGGPDIDFSKFKNVQPLEDPHSIDWDSIKIMVDDMRKTYRAHFNASL